MTTRNIVPRADGEGGIGTSLKKWATGFFGALTAGSIVDTSGNQYCRIYRGTSAPSDTSGATMWLDTSASPYILKWYDTTNSAWISNVNFAATADNANYAKYSPPVGTLIDFAGSTAPSGYLVCDGTAVSRTTYSDLFTVIGTTYGAGDGSTTFTLPNLIDKFKQGSSTIGTYKSAGLPNASGSTYGIFMEAGETTNYALSKNCTGTFDTEVSTIGASHGLGMLSLNLSNSNSIYGNSTTVQPPALTVLPCIKY